MNPAGGVRGGGWAPVLLLLAAAGFAASLLAGPAGLSPGDVLAALVGRPESAVDAAVVLRVRLPRALLAAFVGASLGASGGAFQAVLRNPLADPYVLGVSGGAALGAVAALAVGASSPYAVPAAAFLGALGALGCVQLLGRGAPAAPTTLLLAGVMVGSFASALLLFLLWAAPADPLRSALFWLAGDLSGADPRLLGPACAWGTGAFLALWAGAPALDLLSQGEETASDLGLESGRTRAALLGCAGALVAAAVALAGLVGFVGLIVPHAVRLLWGPSHRRLLPASALLGCAFLLGADALARTVFAPAELPVGVVTALVGAPCFLYLLRGRGARS